jgi:hypothetical protein
LAKHCAPAHPAAAQDVHRGTFRPSRWLSRPMNVFVGCDGAAVAAHGARDALAHGLAGAMELDQAVLEVTPPAEMGSLKSKAAAP